jgi:hypothetical protein
MSDVGMFLDAAERCHGARPESELTGLLRSMPSELLTPARAGERAAPGAGGHTQARGSAGHAAPPWRRAVRLLRDRAGAICRDAPG